MNVMNSKCIYCASMCKASIGVIAAILRRLCCLSLCMWLLLPDLALAGVVNSTATETVSRMPPIASNDAAGTVAAATAITATVAVPTAVDIGIVAVLRNEFEAIKRNISNQNIVTLAGVTYLTGVMHDNSVALVQSGVGSTNVTLAAAQLIRDFNPSGVLLFGSAGAVKNELNIGDVIFGGKVYSLDFGDQTTSLPMMRMSEDHHIRGGIMPLVFSGDKKLLSVFRKPSIASNLKAHDANNKQEKAKLIKGVIVSSDHFPNTALDVVRMKRSRVDAVDIGGAAFMQTCWVYKKRCLVVRGISNVAGDNSGVSNSYVQWSDANRKLSENNVGLAVDWIIGKQGD